MIKFIIGVCQSRKIFNIDSSYLEPQYMNAFREESTQLGYVYDAELIRLPHVKPAQFHCLLTWFNKRKLENQDPIKYDASTHVSEWCKLHVLARRFFIEDLAKYCLKQYRECRGPHWQDDWMPLPAEVDYTYCTSHAGEHVSSLKDLLVAWALEQLLSDDRLIDFLQLASLMRRSSEFMVDIMRAHHAHLASGRHEWNPMGCEISNCKIHPCWSRPDSI